jgi:hypothetical protein
LREQVGLYEEIQMMHRNSSWKLAVLALALSGVLCLGATPVFAQQATERQVTVNLRDLPLRAAIDALFAGTGYQYSVNPDVQNVPVNLNVRDLGLQPALRLLLRQAAVAQPGLTVSKEGDLFVVKVRREAPAGTAVEEAPPEFSSDSAEFTWEKIPVQFNNVAVFVLAFGGQMLPTEADVLLGSLGGGQGGGFGGGQVGGGFGGGVGSGGGFGGGVGNGGGFGTGLGGGSFGGGGSSFGGGGFGGGSNLGGGSFGGGLGSGIGGGRRF